MSTDSQMTIGSALTRRTFLGSAAAAVFTAPAAGGDWVELFDGRTLQGWRVAGSAASWGVSEGLLSGNGPESLLVRDDPVRGAELRNFDLIAEIKTARGCESGIRFHLTPHRNGDPAREFKVSISNTAAGHTGRYRTGSLYGLRGIHKALVDDECWFEIGVSVRANNVQVYVNGICLVDYVEPSDPSAPQLSDTIPSLPEGSMALESGKGGAVYCRAIRMRPLPEDTPAVPPPVADEVFRRIVQCSRRNIPMADFHVHLKEGLTLEQALAKSRRDGIFYGIAVNGGKGFPIENDEGIERFHDTMKRQPVFVAMQAEGREWTGLFSRRVVSLFDYVFTDSMTWSDDNGRRMRLWIPEEVGTITAPETFMDLLVRRAVRILKEEPIDIYVNPTYLPDSIAGDYDRLWTEGRMEEVIQAAAKNQVAIEMNDRYKIPSAAFIRRAKQAGCKFTFGTNNSGPQDLGRSEYGLRMVDECGLEWQDFFVPQAWWPKAVDRKGDALRA